MDPLRGQCWLFLEHSCGTDPVLALLECSLAQSRQLFESQRGVTLPLPAHVQIGKVRSKGDSWQI